MLSTMLFFSVALSKKDEKKEEEDCGELCQYLLGILAEQVFKSIIVPGVNYLVSSPDIFLNYVGYIIIIFFIIVVFITLVSNILEFLSASMEERKKMTKKITWSTAGVITSRKFL